MGPNGSNGVKLGQTGKMVIIGGKLDQTGKSGPNVAKYKSNRANWGQIGPNSQIGQTEPNWVKWSQSGQKGTKQGQQGQIGIK